MKSNSQLNQNYDSLHIMVVDDEHHVGLFIEVLLSNRGFSVSRYMDAKEALIEFTENPSAFDLVLTDQSMPKLCGSDLAKNLLSIRADIPVILCTGYSHEDIVVSTSEIGISAYLHKPLQPVELLQQIDRLISINSHMQ